jgi:hypothetical protein
MRVQIKRNFTYIKELGYNICQIFTVKEVKIHTMPPYKYPNECKYYICYDNQRARGIVKFDYTEVKEV